MKVFSSGCIKYEQFQFITLGFPCNKNSPSNLQQLWRKIYYFHYFFFGDEILLLPLLFFHFHSWVQCTNTREEEMLLVCAFTTSERLTQKWNAIFQIGFRLRNNRQETFSSFAIKILSKHSKNAHELFLKSAFFHPSVLCIRCYLLWSMNLISMKILCGIRWDDWVVMVI
jgi:hypothetical protein